MIITVRLSSISIGNAVLVLRIKYIFKNIDGGKKCLAVFLELAKTFDTISVPLFIKKLERVDVKGHVA